MDTIKVIGKRIRGYRRHAEKRTKSRRLRVAMEAKGRAQAYATVERLLRAIRD